MSTKAEIEALIIQQLSGNATVDEERQVQDWIRQSDANRHEYQQLKQAWELAAIEHPVNVDNEWQKFQQRHFKDTKVVDLHRKEMSHTRWYSMAAAVLLLMGLALSGWYFSGSNIYNTLEGGRLAVNLSDGSEVLLGASSELRVPRSFGWWNRDLDLQGEAYFEVTKNPDKPFTIQGPLTTTQVLGTAFRLVASTDENLLEVTEGKVAYRLPETNQEVIVTAGQKASVETGELEKTNAENPNYDSWKTGRFRFENTPVMEVLNALQNYYHFDVAKLEKFEEVNCRFTGSFERPELDEALEELSLTMGMEYEWEGSTLNLTEFHCN